ncbi:hypothetical protein [Rhodococcoides fascians]|nr:hypothetical protein [Rhodococcus fascians]
MATLHERIEHQLSLVREARDHDDRLAECRHSEVFDNLLARVPHDTRF